MPAEMPNDVSAEKPCSAEHRDGARSVVAAMAYSDLAALKTAFNALHVEAMKPKTFRVCCRGDSFCTSSGHSL